MQTTFLRTVLTALLMVVTTAAFADKGPMVLFDQGHGQRFTIEESGELHLSGLAAIVREKNATVASTTSPLTDELLSGVTALVISGPFRRLTVDESDAIVRFLERGGRVAVMLHIGAPFADLLERLRIDFSNSVLHEQRNTVDQDTQFRVVDLSSDPIFAGVNKFTLYGGWALNPGTAASGIARTSDQAWVDLDGNRMLSQGDAIGAFSVVVSGRKGAGTFIVFGDDAMFQNRYLDESNRRLAANLGAWLTDH